MTPQEIVSLLTDSGLGIASFAALCFFGYKVMGAANLFMTNHMAHIQDSLEFLVRNSGEANDKLDQMIAKLQKD